jgi:hypothetical protein
MNQTAQTVKPMLIDARTAARMLSICERTLWVLTHKDKQIPFVRVRRRVLYSPVDLQAWIDSRKQKDRAAENNFTENSLN